MQCGPTKNAMRGLIEVTHIRPHQIQIVIVEEDDELQFTPHRYKHIRRPGVRDVRCGHIQMVSVHNHTGHPLRVKGTIARYEDGFVSEVEVHSDYRTGSCQVQDT